MSVSEPSSTLADRAYARIGYRLPLVVAALGVMVSLASVVVFVVIVTAGILNQNPYEAARATAFASGIVGFALATSIVIFTVRDYRPLARWYQRDRPDDGAIEAWTRVNTMGLEGITLGAWMTALLLVPGFTWWVGEAADLGPRGYLGVAAFTCFGIAANWAAIAFLADLAIKPLVEDIAAQLPLEWEPPLSRWTVRTKLTFSLPIASVATAVIVTGLIPENGLPEVRLIVAATVVAIVVALLAIPLLRVITSSVMEPLSHLGRAAERVRRGELDTLVPLTTSDEFGTVAARFNAMIGGLRERELLYSAVSAYIDPVIAQKVAHEGAHVEGELAEVTVLFSDIVDYTGFSEGRDPREVVAFLNEFFELAIGAVVRHGGHANKLIGDGLMAVFGVPTKLNSHADAALGAAAEIQVLVAEALADTLRCGIGINSGSVVVGSMGGAGKLDYTIIGDPVNVAARVEAMTRKTGDRILVTGETKSAASSDGWVFASRGVHPLKGRSDVVELFALQGSRTSD